MYLPDTQSLGEVITKIGPMDSSSNFNYHAVQYLISETSYSVTVYCVQ